MEVQETALGELNLHPWELDRYTYKDLVYKIRGRRKVIDEEWQRTRAVAYAAASVGFKKKMSIERFWPFPSDKKKKKEEVVEKAMSVFELAQKMGLVKSDKKKTG